MAVLEELPSGLKYINIIKGELIVRFDSFNGDLLKVSVDEIMEVYSRQPKVIFQLIDYKELEFSVEGNARNVSDAIIEFMLKHLEPSYI